MKELRHYLWVIIIIVLFSSTMLMDRIKSFLIWYITINYEESPLSITGQILCRVLSPLLSFYFVGALFKRIGWFSSRAMRIAYFFVSLFVSMVVSYIIMIFEQYMVLICCLLKGIALATVIVVFVSRYHSKEKAEQ